MIKEYFHYRKSMFLFFLCIVILFPLIHYLYHYPMDSVIYSVVLVSFLFIVWIVIDFYCYREKLMKLDTILSHISYHTHELPAGKNIMEQKYNEIIQHLYGILDETMSLMDKSHNEQMEYYTMWVHQIKTPISAMRLALQSGDLSQKNALIDHELFKIEQYVEMALQYIKMKTLASDLVIGEYSLKEMVNQSVKKYAYSFIYKKLSIEIEDIERNVLTDSKWFTFILEQILSNGIKYTYQGGIRIYTKENSLIIEDTGIGIRKEDMDRIFEKGYTGYNGRLDKKASGIGLYLVKKVADYLALDVKIDSQVGNGTKVMITFPDLNNEIFL
jgi:signal transduction histidine kinase